MQIIKPILIVCFIVLLLAVFRYRGRASLRAGWRVVAVLLALAATVAVVDPDIAQSMANAVGVARGTDLLLYGLVVVFALSTLSLYFSQREADIRTQRLARRVALSEAVLASGPPGSGSTPESIEALVENLNADDSDVIDTEPNQSTTGRPRELPDGRRTEA